MGIVSSNRITEKLKLLYILHLPPLLSKSEIESNKQRQLLQVKQQHVNKSNKSTKDDTEVATEAEDFFG